MRSGIVGILVAFTLAATAAEAANTRVTSRIKDASASGALLSVRSDGQGAYVFVRNSVESIIQDCGTNCTDWELDTTLRTSTRKVFLDFSDPLTIGTPSPFGNASSAIVPTRFISKCHVTGVNMFTMALGAVGQCPLFIRFNSGTKSYRVEMSPNAFPQTDWASFTCTALATSGSCNRWLMTPSAAGKNRGMLVEVNTKTNASTPVGEFYMDFEVDISAP